MKPHFFKQIFYTSLTYPYGHFLYNTRCNSSRNTIFTNLWVSFTGSTVDALTSKITIKPRVVCNIYILKWNKSFAKINENKNLDDIENNFPHNMRWLNTEWEVCNFCSSLLNMIKAVISV